MINVFHIIKALVFTFASTLSMANQIVVYPHPGDIYTSHHRYPIELLELALSYQTEPYSVAHSTIYMTQSRSIEQLRQGRDIDVMWTMTSRDREAKVLPIRIPIYKGLIGWRLFLSTDKQLENKSYSSDINELKKAKILQGHDWPDTKILSQNGFNVMAGSNYNGLFHILSRYRAELFPRSIIEIWNELEIHKNSNIALEPKLLISYPTATYYFVSPDNFKLAKVIEDGLKQAIKDGKFKELFDSHYSEIIKKASLDNRIHFRLDNPLLPELTPLDDKSLWFNLDKAK